ncbi:MAG: EAL domain-containing protein [Pseudomonadota bacterium]
MRKWFKANTAFATAVAVYLLGIIGYAAFEYQQARRVSLQAIDEQLLTTVSFAENILQQQVGERLSGDSPLTIDEDYFLSLKLQELAERMQVVYVYSLIRRDDAIFFTSSNPTPEEMATNDLEYVFLSAYEEAPSAAHLAFSSGEIQYAQYKDRWGAFRSVFFPLSLASGQRYVIGVDINIARVGEAALASLLKAILYGLSLALIVFPMVCVYLKTIRAHYQQRLDSLKVHPLTGLPNQRQLQQLIGNSDNEQLLVVEIENFDHIASTFGVWTSDEIILKLAFRLQELAVSGIEHCRWYQLDEHQFALFSTHYFSEKQTRLIVSSVFRCLTKTPIYTDDQQAIPLVVRMGAVRNQTDPLMLAGMALIHAKKNNQSLTIYQPHLNLPYYFRRYVDTFNLLNDALNNDRLIAYFQPVLDTQTGSIIKYEALARLLDREGNIVSCPDDFMPVAYKSRLCHKLTRLMITRVIDAINGSRYRVVINLSVKDLFDEQTRKYIIKTLRESEVGIQIEFELLEQQMISNYRLAGAYITQLKSCVSQIGMDDLGKLYSNFDRLFALPLDFVKIDGNIINAIQRDSDARSLVEGVVSFARQKGIQVIAEHCSSQEICDMVSLLDVHLMQGFHIGPPAKHFVDVVSNPRLNCPETFTQG